MAQEIETGCELKGLALRLYIAAQTFIAPAPIHIHPQRRNSLLYLDFSCWRT